MEGGEGRREIEINRMILISISHSSGIYAGADGNR